MCSTYEKNTEKTVAKVKHVNSSPSTLGSLSLLRQPSEWGRMVRDSGLPTSRIKDPYTCSTFRQGRRVFFMAPHQNSSNHGSNNNNNNNNSCILAQRNLSTDKKIMDMENRLVVAKGERMGWTGNLRLIDANYCLWNG